MLKGLQWELTTTREWQHAVYLGDRWQVSRKLTLTAGFRFEHFPFVKRDNRNVEWVDYGSTMPCESLDPAPACFTVVLDNDIGSQSRLAPRIGLAYRLSDKNVLRAGYGIANSPVPFGRTHGFGVYPMEIGANFESADPFVPQFRLEEGIPSFVGPDTSPGARIPLPSFALFRGSAPRGTKRAYVQSWNLTLERQFPADFVISLAYVGTQTTNRSVLRNLNWSKPGTGVKGLQLYPFNTAFQGVFDGAVSANYHSLQIAVNRQLDKGLSLRGAYTWAKGISGSWGEEDGWGRLAFHDPALWSRNRTLDSLTRPHNLQLAALYQLPFGSRSGVVNSIVRDWALNGIFSLHSNTPSTVVDNGSALRATGNDQTADQVKPAILKLGGIGPGNPYFDPQAFAPVSRVPGVDCTDLDCYGNSGGKILRGPAWVNLNVSAFRRFAPTEEIALELRVEALNVTNTPHFVLNPSLDVRNPDYMDIRSTSPNAPNRIIRLGLRLSF